MKQTIDVNGIRYDAVSGKVFGAGTGTSYRPARNIDGFFRARPSGTTPGAAATVIAPAPRPASQKPAAVPALKTTAAAPAVPTAARRQVNHARPHVPQSSKRQGIRVRNDTPHGEKLTVRRTPAPINHTHAHATQRATTLMRTAVTPPSPSFHRQVRTKAALQHAAPSIIVPKRSVSHINTERLVRAQTISRSPLIGRHYVQATPVLPAIEPLSVQAAPSAPTPPDNQPPMTPPPTPTNKPAEDIFEHALANATHFVDMHAHHAQRKKQTRQRVASLAAGVLALLVIAGFAVYQNTPGLQFKVASIRAGVATSMPDFKAAGFAMQSVKAGNGKLYVGLASGNTTYQLTQQPTNLSPTDMIADTSTTTASGRTTYQTLHIGHTEVYRLSGTRATWISKGQWYSVTGATALSDSQLTALVQHI